jgi:hypothetical protein
LRDQVPFQESNLGRFTGAVTAFESDETNHEFDQQRLLRVPLYHANAAVEMAEVRLSRG